MKDVKKPFANLENVNFKPDATALTKADAQGWKSVETVIVDGLSKNIMDERVVIVESAIANIKMHDEAIMKMEPKEEAEFGMDRQKIVKQPSFTNSQLKELEKREGKRNKIAKALNTVMIEFNDKSFKELKKIVNDNKAS